ncbi:MAG: hypothetical protein U1E05_07875 [Patescibacteria group bacterium]|nr:hypothetical protein [Patescibacteria group bacterium]
MSDVQNVPPFPTIDVTLLEPIRWRTWPLARSIKRSAALLLGIVAVALLVQVTVGSWSLALLALGAICVSLWRFLTPVTFGLSEHGVDQWIYGRRLRIPWRAIRRYQVCMAGVLIIPHGERTVMAPFRGLYLPWEGHCDEVLAYMHHYLDAPAA